MRDGGWCGRLIYLYAVWRLVCCGDRYGGNALGAWVIIASPILCLASNIIRQSTCKRAWCVPDGR